nr:VF530 family protein [uncultured Flavobacterium sp.]
MQNSKDPLHGKKLIDILEELIDFYQGFEGLANQIQIRCFTHDPSINSSLKFLRKTPWARQKVESLYLYVLRQKAKLNKG